MDTKTAWQTLRDYAEGRIGHTYASCPDHVEGHDSRDAECLVCQALEAVAGAAPAAVTPLPAVLEQIAQGWDGCKYDAPGETLDIGADIRAAAKRLLAEQPAAVAEPVLDVRAIAAAVCQRVAELPDRNSPEDWPEAMLVTVQELIDVVTCELEQALEAPALEAPAAPACPYTGFAARYWTLGYQGHDCPPTTGPVSREAYDAGARARLAAAPQAPAAPVGMPAQGDPAALLQLAAVLESGRSLIDIERKEAAEALRRQAAAPAAPSAAGSAYAEMPAPVAHSLGLAKYAHSSNIIAAHEFTPDAEHADEWDSLVTLDQARAFADATHALRIAVAAPAAPAVDAQEERDAAFEAVRQRLCRVPRWSFHLDSRGNIRRVDDAHGNWIEFSAAHELFDPVAVDAALAAQAKEGGEA